MNIGIDIDNTLTNTSIVSNTLVKQDILYRGANDYHDLNKEDKKDFLSKYLVPMHISACPFIIVSQIFGT